MRRHARSVRPQRLPQAARQLPRTTTIARKIIRTPPPIRRRIPVGVPMLPPDWSDIEAGPYLDYSRSLTPEGGVLVVYKDIATALRHILWRVLAWIAYTGFEALLFLSYSPVDTDWINDACLAAAAAINLFILWSLPQLYRSVEIRPDCMIIEGRDVFWLSNMETAWPAFGSGLAGDQVLSGIYGTRFIKYLTVRRFDANDRTPEVFAAHLREAMEQLWAPPDMLGKRPNGAPRWKR